MTSKFKFSFRGLQSLSNVISNGLFTALGRGGATLIKKIVEMIDMIFKFIMGCQRKGGAHYMSVCHTYINSNKR